jgi:hypothetical protein
MYFITVRCHVTLINEGVSRVENDCGILLTTPLNCKKIVQCVYLLI